MGVKTLGYLCVGLGLLFLKSDIYTCLQELKIKNHIFKAYKQFEWLVNDRIFIDFNLVNADMIFNPFRKVSTLFIYSLEHYWRYIISNIDYRMDILFEKALVAGKIYGNSDSLVREADGPRLLSAQLLTTPNNVVSNSALNAKKDISELSVRINGEMFTFQYQSGTQNGTPQRLATLFCKDPNNGLGLISTEWDACISQLSEELFLLMNTVPIASATGDSTNSSSDGHDRSMTPHNEGGHEKTTELTSPVAYEQQIAVDLKANETLVPAPASHVATEMRLTGDGPTAASQMESEVQLTADGVRHLPLEINGITYVFEYHTALDTSFTAKRLATEFCTAKGAAVGIFIVGAPDSVIHETCVAPITKAIKVELVIANLV